jgi:tetratricopeptide (TPR) repeat protein
MKHSITRILPQQLLTVLAGMLLLAPAAVRAAECPESSPEDPQERRRLAKEWFSTAETAENLGNDVEATRAYACSYKMVAHPFTAFNLARVAERSGENELSLKMYKAYLALKPDAQDKEEVKGRIQALEEKMATGQEAPATEPTPPTETATEEPTPPPDVLTPPPEPKPADVVQTKPEPEPEPETRSRKLEWIIGGASVAALAGGIVTNLIARAKMDTCRTDAANNLLAKADDECNAARPMAYTSYALFGVAAAGIATDAVLLILRRSSADEYYEEEASYGFLPLPGGGGVIARGRF